MRWRTKGFMYRPVPPARPIIRASAVLLKGIGVKKELLDSTIRFSLGDLNTEEEVDYAIGVLGELLPVLRRYQMK